ncbi:hypothetical protein ACIGZJ_17130 [Kitasatospora sp. NPDC052868]|uniref:hypothetical protein n=1 Tax=Kitasatospora sp. NPDC052868 TaxID=3364060 RepID=UPI0037C9EC45
MNDLAVTIDGCAGWSCHLPDQAGKADHHRVAAARLEDSGVDGSQLGTQLAPSSGAQVPCRHFQERADVPGWDVGVSVAPLLSATGPPGTQSPASEGERDITSRQASFALECGYLSVR